MIHFAELNENNIVTNIVLVSDEDAPNEESGVIYLQNLLGSDKIFKKCMRSEDDPEFRKRHPSIGYTYDEINDVFIFPQRFDSWALDENFEWHPPTPKPENTDDNWFEWDEDTTSWIAREYDDEPLGEVEGE